MEIQEQLVAALAHHQAGRLGEAERIYREVLAREPNNSDALNLLGVLAAQVGRTSESVDLIRRAVDAQPFPEGWYNLGISLQGMDKLDDAITAYRQAIRMKPDYAEAHANLGKALRNAARLDEAIACFREAIRLNPNLLYAYENLIFALPFHPSANAAMVLAETRKWERQFAAPLARSIEPHPNDRNPDRRLRIGYVSPNFREHCQTLFTIPLFSYHDHGNFEIFCYSSVTHPGPFTEQIRSYADQWREIAALSDADAARRIREDRIDILVDLTMHMAGGRLLIFARKPAPVQVAWLAYPGTTGLSAIDYRLSDPYLDPPGGGDEFYAEKTIRLPETFWCYDPLDGELPISPLPAQTAGYVTFGCLNDFIKINDHVLRLWARVLADVPGSRMMILCPEGAHRKALLSVFGSQGIEAERIEFVTFVPRGKYLERYHKIDLGLDAFPYNGHTTSLDSCWMGVPVITLAGQMATGRAGVSQLTNLGMTELIARTPEEFVKIACDLANDLPRLVEIRRTIRPRMKASPLMDGARFARNIEAAYRGMWREWCESVKV
jgi:predicted O-linked N-acetylglucosamine transferase (SPINDLY family)